MVCYKEYGVTWRDKRGSAHPPYHFLAYVVLAYPFSTTKIGFEIQQEALSFREHQIHRLYYLEVCPRSLQDKLSCLI